MYLKIERISRPPVSEKLQVTRWPEDWNACPLRHSVSRLIVTRLAHGELTWENVGQSDTVSHSQLFFSRLQRRSWAAQRQKARTILVANMFMQFWSSGAHAVCTPCSGTERNSFRILRCTLMTRYQYLALFHRWLGRAELTSHRDYVLGSENATLYFALYSPVAVVDIITFCLQITCTERPIISS